MENNHPILSRLDPRKLICLDAEFAQGYGPGAGLAMLELSISGADGKMIYSKRFKPTSFRRWRLNPHNISPADVARAPRFRDCIGEIRRIINEADYITGFALENDFRRLEEEGIVIPESKKVIELRDWFWSLYGRERGLDLVEGISNERVAQEFGVSVDESLVHTSAYDIHLSLESLGALLRHALPDPGDMTMERFYDLTQSEFLKKKEDYDRERASGYCYIERRQDGYMMRTVRQSPGPERDVIACVAVADRKKAQIELSRMLTGRVLSSAVMLRSLSDTKLQRFLAYRNEFDPATSAMQSKLMKLAAGFGGK